MNLFKEILCEFLGTFVLMFFGTSSILLSANSPHMDDILVPAFGFFSVIVALVHLIGPTSGCHINPAVTLALALMGRIHPIHAFLYSIAQMAGGAAGTGYLYLLSPREWVDKTSLGMTKVNPSLNLYQAVAWEVTITTLLVLAILLLTENNPNREFEGVPAYSAGFTVVACIFSGAGATGASLNPARSFAPALIMWDFKDQWVYFVGPLGSSFVDVLIYKYLLQEGIIHVNPQELPQQYQLQLQQQKQQRQEQKQQGKQEKSAEQTSKTVHLNELNESFKVSNTCS